MGVFCIALHLPKVLLAANLGDDADTDWLTIYGQLAGAPHGEEGIPASWRAFSLV